MRCTRATNKRKSSVLLKEDVSCKKKKSIPKESTPPSDESVHSDHSMIVSSPSVIDNLNELVTNILQSDKLPEAALVELKGFDASAASMEEYMRKKEQIRRLVGDAAFFDRKFELNMGVASLANAQIQVDKRVTTRRMSRKLHDECGIQEKDILYRGLDYRGCETRVSKELRDSRQASIIESAVDIQKQIQWKMSLMDHVKAKTENSHLGKTFPMSDGPSVRTRGGQDKQREAMKQQQKELEKVRKNRKRTEDDPFQTPQKKIEFNALDERRIIENYQLEVASEVRDHRPELRRGIAPLPFNINILDDEEDDE